MNWVKILSNLTFPQSRVIIFLQIVHRKSKSRVIKDEEEIVASNPAYGPTEELVDEGSCEVSTCSTPLDEKTQEPSLPTAIHPK